jgi:hypothetical protein
MKVLKLLFETLLPHVIFVRYESSCCPKRVIEWTKTIGYQRILGFYFIFPLSSQIILHSLVPLDHVLLSCGCWVDRAKEVFKVVLELCSPLGWVVSPVIHKDVGITPRPILLVVGRPGVMGVKGIQSAEPLSIRITYFFPCWLFPTYSWVPWL